MDCIGFNESSWASWETPVEDYQTREGWLVAASERLLASVFPDAVKAPRMRVTCGWPKGVRGGKHAIGQCWDKASSRDGTYEMFISPELEGRQELLETLAHEMVHAIAGCEEGHKGGFAELAKTIGFLKPMTSTPASPSLASTLAIIGLQMGSYPHARLNDAFRKKQTTRMLKAWCPNEGCEIRAAAESDKPFVVRITQSWADLGMPVCPCGTAMVLEGQEGEEESEREAA